MPGSRAEQNLQMPQPRDWQGRQIPRSSPGWGGGGWRGAGGIDWCITKSTSPQLLRSRDLDQISCLTWSGNDQQYKSLLAQLRCNQNLYQPLLFLISSNKSVLKDFTNFARKMSLRYLFEDKRKILAHPFHVKSTWQPPIQNSVALERYLQETKLELASTVFHAPLDYISANERKAVGSLKRNSAINL